MPVPSPLRDHLFVQVDTAALDRTPTGLYIPDWQPGDKDAQQAVVVAVPLSLSDRRLPYPFMDGYAYAYRDLRDLPRVGETVYLKPNTFKPEWEFPGHPGVFLVALDKVIAVAASPEDGGPLVPFQGLLLCEQVYGDDVRMGDKGVRERIGSMNLGMMPEWTRPMIHDDVVLELDPLPIPFTLKVLHTGVPLHQQPDLVQVGDVVVAHKMLFAHHAVKQRDDDPDEGRGRWCWQCSSIVIAGTEYFYIPRQCVMAKTELPIWSGEVEGKKFTLYRSNLQKALDFREKERKALEG